jgi:hypothetical protein
MNGNTAYRAAIAETERQLETTEAHVKLRRAGGPTSVVLIADCRWLEDGEDDEDGEFLVRVLDLPGTDKRDTLWSKYIALSDAIGAIHSEVEEVIREIRALDEPVKAIGAATGTHVDVLKKQLAYFSSGARCSPALAAEILSVDIAKVKELCDAIGFDSEDILVRRLIPMREKLDEIETRGVAVKRQTENLVTIEMAAKMLGVGPKEANDLCGACGVNPTNVGQRDLLEMASMRDKLYEEQGDYDESTGDTCDVCGKEELDDMPDGWAYFTNGKIWVDVCDECTKSDEKLKEGFDVFAEELRPTSPLEQEQ